MPNAATEVKAELERAGFQVVLRSQVPSTRGAGDRRHVFVIDSTGELRDWTAHADVVIIGKSFLATGGQNPSEAILARKPVILRPAHGELPAARRSSRRGERLHSRA